MEARSYRRRRAAGGDPTKDTNVLKDYQRNFVVIVKNGKIYLNPRLPAVPTGAPLVPAEGSTPAYCLVTGSAVTNPNIR